jgi:transcriptional regulator with XRE-family HTH domain
MLTVTKPPTVAPRLREALRQRPDLTWRRLAAASGVHQATIARILAETTDPGRLTIWALARVLGVDAAWLAGYRDDPSEQARAS